MPIQVHDTLARAARPLAPPSEQPLGIYLCGPTVYDDSHIGHLMGPVLFDAVARWLGVRGYRVRFVNNITDIDDKIIDRARRTGEDWRRIATRFESKYRGYLSELRVETITDHPHATDYVPQMLQFIERLIRSDRAYVAADGVYFDVRAQEGYGKLSGRDLDDLRSGERVQAADGLRDPADFALWKAAKPGEPTWESPWGPGRPGWHLECSVMSRALLGQEFEVHGGGDDLKFPHHENEIAQSEAHGDGFARFWMHHGLVQYGGRKVAKSDPRMGDADFSRQFKAAWLLERYGPATLRFFLLRGHYRRPIDFQPESLDAARKGLARMQAALGETLDAPLDEGGYGAAALERARTEAGEELATFVEGFEAAMDDDFNTGEALARLFELADVARGDDASRADRARAVMLQLGRVLGLFHPGDRESVRGSSGDDTALSAAVALLIDLRAAARDSRDFATADRIRDALAEGGVELRDGAGGTGWARAEG
jgi:cysteinyl-tRNA synthetase